MKGMLGKLRRSGSSDAKETDPGSGAAEKKERKPSLLANLKKGAKEGASYITDQGAKGIKIGISKATETKQADDSAGALRFPSLSYVEQRIVTLSNEEGRLSDFTRENAPPANKMDRCHACQEVFSMTLYRYHCSHCGNSFCNEDSPHSVKIPKFGILQKTRVCGSCLEQLLAEGKEERLAWRAQRVEDFLSGNLVPYFDPRDDTKTDKALRVFWGTVYVAQVLWLFISQAFEGTAFSSMEQNREFEEMMWKISTWFQEWPLKPEALVELPFMGALGTAAYFVNSSKVLARFGLAGLGGLMIREDLAQATALAGRVMEGLLPDPRRDGPKVAAAAFYHMAHQRGLRGEDPDLEHKAHRGCPEASAAELAELLRLGNLPLRFVYQEDALEMQRLAGLQGWTLVYASLRNTVERPLFAVFASVETREVALVIRGTKTVMDAVTDARSENVRFPSEQWQQAHGVMDEATRAHKGMASAAEWIFEESYQDIRRLHEEGYQVLVMGHSLGAACAVLASRLLEHLLGGAAGVRTYAFCTPSCADLALAARCADRGATVSVVLRDDAVPRLSPAAARGALLEILDRREAYEAWLREDLAAVKARAKGAWAPRRRAVVPRRPPGRRKGSPPGPPQPRIVTVEQEAEIETEIKHSLEESKLSDDSLSFGGLAAPTAQMQQNFDEVYIPGRILHIYKHNGACKAAWVPRDLPTLRRLELQDNLLDDHRGANVLAALREVRDVRDARESLPSCTPFSQATVCAVCDNDFTWNSTSDSPAQALRDKTHCRRCGLLVCPACSTGRRALPAFGLHVPQAVCDRCDNDAALTW